MCVSIYTSKDTEIDTLGQLRSLVGDDAVTFWEDCTSEIYADRSRWDEGNDWCLCQVDIDETMKKAGYSVKWPDHRMHCDVSRM